MPDTSPVIAPVTEADWPQFHAMDMRTFGDDMIERDGFMRSLDRGGFFSLMLGGHLVGYLMLARYGDSGGHLGRIGVDPDFQGRGFGRKLMDYSLEWFRSQGAIRQVFLYTQDYNKKAHDLYKSVGFRVVGTTWQFSVPFSSARPRHQIICDDIREDEVETVATRYANSLPAAQIRRYLSTEGQHVLTLKDNQGRIVGACRFTPSFPGCFPFEIDHVDLLDDFVEGVRRKSLPQFDYVRITYTDNHELTQLCEKRRYRLQHRLYKMTLDLPTL